jgi:hypothetical protein
VFILIKGTYTGKGYYLWVIIIIPHTFAIKYFWDLTSPRGLVFKRPLDPLVFLIDWIDFLGVCSLVPIIH